MNEILFGLLLLMIASLGFVAIRIIDRKNVAQSKRGSCLTAVIILLPSVIATFFGIVAIASVFGIGAIVASYVAGLVSGFLGSLLFKEV